MGPRDNRVGYTIWQVDETIKGMEYGLEHPQQVREPAEQCRVTGAIAPTYFDYGRFNLYKKQLPVTALL